MVFAREPKNIGTILSRGSCQETDGDQEMRAKKDRGQPHDSDLRCPLVTHVDSPRIDLAIVAVTAELCCSQGGLAGGSLPHSLSTGLASWSVNGAVGAGGTIVAAASAEFSDVLRVAWFQS